MRSARILLVVMLVGVLVAGCSQEAELTAPQDQAGYDKDGTEELGTPSIPISDGSGFLVNGVGMVDTDTGNFDLTVPAGATVVQALLYWTGGTTSDMGDDNISVNGNPVAGTQIGGPTNFFGNYNFYAYRADITAEGWVAEGLNSFEITDFDFDFTGDSLDENHGAGLLVIYDDGTAADLSLVDGLDAAYFEFASPLDSTVPKTFTFAAEDIDRVAELVVIAGSVGENRPNEVKVTTTAGDQIFVNELNSSEGPLFDTHVFLVNIPAMATELTVELISVVSGNPQGASLTWIGSGLSVPVSEPPLYCIGDFVWFDENGNGCQDVDEMGVEGVEVNLWVGCPPAEVIATTLTDADGGYMFCELMPGEYTVQFVAPGDYIFCEQFAAGCGTEFDSNADVDGITDCVTLVDANDYTIDAGLCMPPTACLGDFVWEDLNMDGIQDAGEPGREGVTVYLMDCEGNELASTMTDVDGAYMFCDLDASDYSVKFMLPLGYEFSPQDMGNDDALDSDADPTTGMTTCITLDWGDYDMTWDAGIYMPVQDGCTLTIGYWKNWTGLGNGNQPDMVTQYLPINLGDEGGAKTMTVTTAQMAVDVLQAHTYGHPSNGITKLYSQMLASKLNVAYGASDSDIADYLADADAFLADHDYTDWGSLSSDEKDMVRMWHGAFSGYNEGDIGPGHCDYDDDEDEEELFK